MDRKGVDQIVEVDSVMLCHAMWQVIGVCEEEEEAEEENGET